jgi:high affinity Mn2+ porin
VSNPSIDTSTPPWKAPAGSAPSTVSTSDGALTYSGEKIVETYYAYSLRKGMVLTGDYQFFLHPAFNMDRGPVSIFSGRLHVEF